MRCLRLLTVLVFFLLASCSHIQIKPEGKAALTPEESFRLASIYESRGEKELAMREYQNAAEAGYAEAYFAIGNIRLKSSEYKEAEDNFRKAIAINPFNGAYYNNLGWLYMETKRLDEAERTVKEALRVDPSKSYIYLDTIGVIQIKEEKYLDAERSLTVATELAPAAEKEGLREIYGHLLDLYAKTGDKDKAVAIEDKIRGLK